MKTSELRAKSPEELQQELSELLRAQFGMRMQQATQQLGDTSKLAKTRRDIARAKTILHEKARKS